MLQQEFSCYQRHLWSCDRTEVCEFGFQNVVSCSSIVPHSHYLVKLLDVWHRKDMKEKNGLYLQLLFCKDKYQMGYQQSCGVLYGFVKDLDSLSVEKGSGDLWGHGLQKYFYF